MARAISPAEEALFERALFEMCKKCLGDELTLKIYEKGPEGLRVIYQNSLVIHARFEPRG